MRDLFLLNNYKIPSASVVFESADSDLKWIFDECERLCTENRKVYADYNVLIEGSKYKGVWLETQPLGGEMYAKRDIEAALSNILIFVRFQRRDGRYPGMISFKNHMDRVVAHYDWMQGCFFAEPAVKLYYHLGKDREYLEMIYDSLQDFDNYLWKYRDSNGDGCLEEWCIWDTGEDNCTLHILNGVQYPLQGGWGASVPPTDYGKLPFESPQYMAYSYSIRNALAEISEILGNNDKAKEWSEKAEKVRQNAIEILWDDKRSAFYKRDRYGVVIDSLTQENIKCMHLGLMTQEMADAFISKHFMNPNEFWTKYPLPSIAINDPYFHYDDNFSNAKKALEDIGFKSHDIDNNSWSGPTNGLTYQRAIGGLMHYGHHREQIMLAERVIELVKKTRLLIQNYNPMTGEYSETSQNGYGPMVLATLENISLMQGVNVSKDEIFWTSYGDTDFAYTQNFGDSSYKFTAQNGLAKAYINGELVFSAKGNIRAKTDMNGNIVALYGIDAERTSIHVIYKGREFDVEISPNEELAYTDNGFVTVRTVPFN